MSYQILIIIAIELMKHYQIAPKKINTIKRWALENLTLMTLITTKHLLEVVLLEDLGNQELIVMMSIKIYIRIRGLDQKEGEQLILIKAIISMMKRLENSFGRM